MSGAFWPTDNWPDNSWPRYFWMGLDVEVLTVVAIPTVGAGRPGRYVPTPFTDFRRAWEQEEASQEALIASLKIQEELERIEVEKPENILYEAEKRIAKQIQEEQEERNRKAIQREAAFVALEIASEGGLTGHIEQDARIRWDAQYKAKKRLRQWDREKERQDDIKSKRLYNLEKAKLAKAAKKKREDEIKEQRLANLKKARAAKKRKRKKT